MNTSMTGTVASANETGVRKVGPGEKITYLYRFDFISESVEDEYLLQFCETGSLRGCLWILMPLNVRRFLAYRLGSSTGLDTSGSFLRFVDNA